MQTCTYVLDPCAKFIVKETRTKGRTAGIGPEARGEVGHWLSDVAIVSVTWSDCAIVFSRAEVGHFLTIPRMLTEYGRYKCLLSTLVEICRFQRKKNGKMEAKGRNMDLSRVSLPP